MNKPSNINEVAKLAGVSTMTVSRYFNQPKKLADGTREKVKLAVEELAYVPNAAAVTLLRGRSQSLALMFSSFRSPYSMLITQGAEDAAQAQGYTMFLANSHEDIDKECAYLNALVKRRVDGILIVPVPKGSGLNKLENHNIPVVLLDRQIKKSPFDTVRGDSLQGGRVLTEHVIAQGHTDIAFMGGDAGVSTLEQRLQGYKDVMTQAGFEPNIRLGRYDEASGYEIVMSLYKENKVPKTLVAANNRVAVGAMKALREKGIWNDVKIACFDNIDEYFFEIYKPFSAVVAQPAYEMGKRAAEMVIERIEGYSGKPRDVVFPVKLIT